MSEDILIEAAKSKGDISDSIIMALELAKKAYPEVFSSVVARKSVAEKIINMSNCQSVDTFKNEINEEAKRLHSVLNDKLGQKLKNSLGRVSEAVINNFENNFSDIALVPKIRERIADALENVDVTAKVMNTLTKSAQEIKETINDNLFRLLEKRLGKSGALAEQRNFISNYPDIALNKSKRQLLFNQLIDAGIGTHKDTFCTFRNLIENMQNSENKVSLPDEKLHQYLKPLIGVSQTIEVVKYLENANPELVGNEKLKDKFIQEVSNVPDEDKNHMIAAAVKLSTIKNKLLETNDNFEFKEAYKDFENITTRLLKNFYNMAKYTDRMLFDESLSDEEKIESINSPIYVAKSIVLNDTILNKEISQVMASESIGKLKDSASGIGNIESFQLLVQYVAEKSAQSAEIIFDNKEFRNFSKWAKEKAVQDAKKQALTGEKNTDMLLVNSKGIQNG